MAEQIINSRQSLEAYKAHLDAQWEKHRYLRVDAKTGKTRTLTQNAALHLYCSHVADALNDAGLDMQTVLKEGTEIPWSGYSVKEHMWKVVQKAMTGHASTTKPETIQYGPIYDVISRHLSQTHGLFISWPSKDHNKE